MDAQQSGPGGILHGLLRRGNTPQSLFLSIRQDAAQPPGHTMGGKEPPDTHKTLRIGIIDIHIDCSMGVQVQKTGGQQRTLCINNFRALRLGYPAYRFNDPIHAQKRPGPNALIR